MVDVETMTPQECAHHARQLGLGSRRKVDRERAEASIHAMGNNAIPFLLKVLDWLSTRRSRNFWMTFGIGIAVSAAIIPLPLVAPDLWRHEAFQVSVNIVCSALWISLLPWAFPHRLQRQATLMMQQWSDFRTVGHLIGMLEFLSGTDKSNVRAAIISTLSDISSDGASQLGEPALSRLLNVVRGTQRGAPNYDSDGREFAVAAIRTLAAAGELRSLPILQLLAADDSLLGAGLWARNAARDALPLLERAAAAHRVSGTLLRPTESPGYADVLVRPAGVTGDNSPELLVRPAGSSDIPD